MNETQVAAESVKPAAKKSEALALLPLSIARSSLFSVAPKGPMSQHRVIATAKKGVNATITYTGAHLSMEHFRLWQALLFIAEERGQLGGDEFVVSLTDVLQHMGKDYSGKRLKKKIGNMLTEIYSATVTVISDRVRFQNEKLIDVGDLDLETRLMTVRFGERIASRLLDREILRNDIERSREFGRHYLAIWLHGFISSQASRSDKKHTQHTFSVDELRRLCGTQVKERRHFCQDLERALDKLKVSNETGRPLVSDWDWDDKRSKSKVTVEKVHTLVKMLEESPVVARERERTEQGKRVQRSKQHPINSPQGGLVL